MDLDCAVRDDSGSDVNCTIYCTSGRNSSDLNCDHLEMSGIVTPFRVMPMISWSVERLLLMPPNTSSSTPMTWRGWGSPSVMIHRRQVLPLASPLLVCFALDALLTQSVTGPSISEGSS